VSTSMALGTGVFSIRLIDRMRSALIVEATHPDHRVPVCQCASDVVQSCSTGAGDEDCLPERMSSPTALTMVCVAPEPDGVPTTIELPATMWAMIRSCSASASSNKLSVSRLRVSEFPGSTAA